MTEANGSGAAPGSPEPPEPPSIALVREVRARLRPHVAPTPLVRSAWLSERHGADVFLKCENLQVTGSFKARGAFAAVLGLTEEERASGVLACSAGNHGLGLARAARDLDVPCRIVVPRSVPRVKADAIRALGAALVVAPCDGYDATHAWMEARLAAGDAELGRGAVISAYEHPLVVAGGGGTTALEILEDPGLGPLDTLVVPCGGGGCAVGAAVVARAVSPATRVVAVNTDASPGMWRSLRDGRAHLTIEGEPTIADGIEGGVGETSYAWARALGLAVVLAREATIRRAVGELARRERLVVEGAGTAGVAALLDGRLPPGRACVLLTGGNVDAERLAACLAELGGGAGDP